MPPTGKKSKKQSSAGDDDSPEAATKSPSWPVLEPLVLRHDLYLHHIIPNQIITISHFWTASLCKKYVSFLSTLPLATTSKIPKRGDAVRFNDRYQIDDPSFAETLWTSTGLKDLVLQALNDDEEGNNDGITNQTMSRSDSNLWGGDVIGLNPNIRIYRYQKGQYFDKHYDDSQTLTHTTSPTSNSTPAKTTWTLLLYLTSPTTGCVGGETVFYPSTVSTTKPKTNKNKQSGKEKSQCEREGEGGKVVVGLETGMALLHKHGRECMLHEGKMVEGGEKWVLRSDLCVRR